jgi:hypothetical protein
MNEKSESGSKRFYPSDIKKGPTWGPEVSLDSGYKINKGSETYDEALTNFQKAVHEFHEAVLKIAPCGAIKKLFRHLLAKINPVK